MEHSKNLNVLHLTNHLNIGGITSYVHLLGSEMMKRGHRMGVASSGGLMEDLMKNSGFSLHPLSMKTKNILSPKIFFSALKLAKIVRKEKVDLMHAHSHVTQVLAALTSMMTGVPCVSTCHGYFRRRLGRRLFPLWGKRVVAISEPVARDLEKCHRVPKKKITVVRNAINIAGSQTRFAQHDPKEIRFWYQIPEDAPVVVSIARLSDDKGHDIFVKAAAKILQTRKDIYFIIFGDGREKDRLKNEVEGLDIESRFFVISSVKDPTVGLAVADIFVHTATRREGFGLAIAEAMALGKPVILTDIPAINQIYTHEEHCLVVKPSDPTALSAAIEDFLAHPDKRARIAASGKQFANSFFKIERMAREMETVYLDALGR